MNRTETEKEVGLLCTKAPQGQDKTRIPEPGEGREWPREGVRCNPLTNKNKPNKKANWTKKQTEQENNPNKTLTLTIYQT